VSDVLDGLATYQTPQITEGFQVFSLKDREAARKARLFKV
jgi:hypothetical protein